MPGLANQDYPLKMLPFLQVASSLPIWKMGVGRTFGIAGTTDGIYPFGTSSARHLVISPLILSFGITFDKINFFTNFAFNFFFT